MHWRYSFLTSCDSHRIETRAVITVLNSTYDKKYNGDVGDKNAKPSLYLSSAELVKNPTKENFHGKVTTQGNLVGPSAPDKVSVPWQKSLEKLQRTFPQ